MSDVAFPSQQGCVCVCVYTPACAGVYASVCSCVPVRVRVGGHLWQSVPGSACVYPRLCLSVRSRVGGCLWLCAPGRCGRVRPGGSRCVPHLRAGGAPRAEPRARRSGAEPARGPKPQAEPRRGPPRPRPRPRPQPEPARRLPSPGARTEPRSRDGGGARRMRGSLPRGR